MKRSYVISVVICFAIWKLGIFFARGSFLYFINAPSLMIVIIPSVAMLCAHFSPGRIVQSISLAMKHNNGTEKEIKSAILVFTSLQKYIICSAFIGFILGIILILSHADDPSVLGKGLATSLLTIFYAAVFILLITVPFAQALKNKL